MGNAFTDFIQRTNQSRGFRRFKRNRAAVFSLGFVIFVALVGVFAPWIAPHSFEDQFIDHVLEAPSSQFWMGTDSLGRDLFSRLIYGARMSMAVGILTALISVLIGGLYGLTAGWNGGRIDSVMMRAVDTLNSIPSLVLLILAGVVFTSYQPFENPELRALFGILFALSIVGWVTLARVVRGQVLQAKEMLFVEGAIAMGASPLRIILKHIVPNIIGPVVVLLTFQIPANILFESFLSFVGLGLQPPYSSWGVLANDGWRAKSSPHLILFPGLALYVTMLAFNLFGDGLRDAVDPR